MKTHKKLIFVGTYTENLGFVDGKAKGIYTCWFDPDSGEMENANRIEGIENPSYLAVHPDGKHLYAVNELAEFRGIKGGSVSALEIDPSTGGLKLLNQQPTYGEAPCNVKLDLTGRFAMVANYTGGNVAIYPIQTDGSLGKASDTVQHTGKGVDLNRQEGPHAHSITPDPTNAFALACDLGLDKVFVYRLDLDKGKLIPNAVPYATLHPGAGPRHLDFHPNGKYVYVINELDATLTAFTWDAQAGVLSELQTVSTLPVGVTGPKSCADIHVHPSGKYLYGSNRGHDSLVIFAINEVSGKLTYIGHESTQGKTPRGFTIDPSGAFLLAANQDSNSVIVFQVDPQSGKLKPAGKKFEIPTPVCLKFQVG